MEGLVALFAGMALGFLVFSTIDHVLNNYERSQAHALVGILCGVLALIFK